MLLLLDSGPLGLITHPRGVSEAAACVAWFKAMLKQGAKAYIPEIIDYELRRELIRTHLKSGVVTGLAQLDTLATELTYLPLTTATMRRAAELWARARNQGRQPAADEALDIDMILTAQALELASCLGEATTVVTTNPKHLKLFIDARHWRDIQP